jgi:hypothetical protein
MAIRAVRPYSLRPFSAVRDCARESEQGFSSSNGDARGLPGAPQTRSSLPRSSAATAMWALDGLSRMPNPERLRESGPIGRPKSSSQRRSCMTSLGAIPIQLPGRPVPFLAWLGDVVPCKRRKRVGLALASQPKAHPEFRSQASPCLLGRQPNRNQLAIAVIGVLLLVPPG